MRPVVLAQINLIVQDMDASISFYRRLGWTIETPTPDHARAVLSTGLRVEFDTPSFAAAWDTGYSGGTGGSALLGMQTATRDDVDALYADLVAHGGGERQPAYDAFWGSRFAIVDDPDGNPVGLLSPVDAARRFWPPSTPPTASR